MSRRRKRPSRRRRDGLRTSEGHDSASTQSPSEETGAEDFNRVQVVYNNEHSPYLYGAIHVIEGPIQSQRWHRPFIISKTANGEEVVYGTVTRTLTRILDQVNRFSEFSSTTHQQLVAAGIEVSGDSPVLPKTDLTDAIIEEQDRLIEDVLLSTSVYVRILSEMFPKKLQRAVVPIYDYDGEKAGDVSLKHVGNLMVHNRFVTIRDNFVVDLISDEEFLGEPRQMGLKFDFAEYLDCLSKVIESFTVKELVTILWAKIKHLSASGLDDIVFVTQNLYTLGGLVAGVTPRLHAGPMKTILDGVAKELYEQESGKGNIPAGQGLDVTVVFGPPRFYLEPDLAEKKIRTQMTVNGNPETLVMGYEDFFRSVLKVASGNKLLHGLTPGDDAPRS